MSEVIVITSGKGGVGKTTTTANVGTGLAQLDKKVVLIDTDIGLRNLDVVMGLENRIVYNLVDVVEGNCRIKQALIKHKKYPNLFLLPSAQTRDKTSVNPEQMKKLIEDLMEASKASTGNLPVHSEVCDTTVMLTQVVGEFSERAKEQQLELVVDCPNPPLNIFVDGRHLCCIH